MIHSSFLYLLSSEGRKLIKVLGKCVVLKLLLRLLLCQCDLFILKSFSPSSIPVGAVLCIVKPRFGELQFSKSVSPVVLPCGVGLLLCSIAVSLISSSCRPCRRASALSNLQV